MSYVVWGMWAFAVGLWGFNIGVRYAQKRASKQLAKEAEELTRIAEDKVRKSIQTAGAIEAMLGREMFKIVQNRFPFPYDDGQVTDYIRSKVNPN